MRLLHSAPRRRNPYPLLSRGLEIREIRFGTGLLLARLKDAPRSARGEDAHYIVGADYHLRYTLDDRQREVIVPQGMLTDLTSVPWFARWLVAKVGKHLEAVIVHDYLYIAWQDVPGRGALEEDRAFADDLMLAVMEASGVRAWRARLIHLAVRLFGGPTYRAPNSPRYLDMTAPEVLAQFSKDAPLKVA